MDDGTTFVFGAFQLRVDPPALYQHGRPVKLQGQPLRLLALLASRPAELVTHREIHRHLWHDHVVDFTGGTHVCMRQIRAALNEDAGKPRYIETVARHGYRFIAPVRPVVGEASADAAPELPPANVPTRRRVRLALAGAALLASVAFVALSIRGELLPFPGAASAAGTDPRVLELYENAKRLASYEQRDRQVLAHSLLRRALAIDPEHGPTHALIADLITQKGTAILGIEGGRDYELVEHHLEIAARHGADASDILVTRGRQLLYGERRLGPAFDAMQRAIDANPANPAAWQLISHVHYLQGRFDEALAASRRAEELSADPNGVLWDRLQIFYLSEQYEELFALYKRLDHTQKPIWTYQRQYPPAKFVLDDGGRVGMAVNSMVSGGCIVSGARVDQSLMFSNVRVDELSYIERAVIFPDVRVGRGCVIKRAIIDSGGVVPDGTQIGVDPQEDARRFYISEQGVVLVTRDMLAGLARR